MLTRLLLAACLLWGSQANAQITNCDGVRFAERVIDEGFEDLVRNYPGTLAYYGFSGFVLKESNPQRTEEVVGGLAAAFVGCAILIDIESCDFVAGRLTTLLTASAVMCAADHRHRCGVCR